MKDDIGNIHFAKKSICCRSSKKGFSLVEAIVGIALLGMVALLLVSAYYAQFAIIQQNEHNKVKAKNSQRALEKEIAGEESDAGAISGTSRDDGTFIVDFGGLNVYTDGDYVTGEASDGAYKYKFFEPES